MCLEAFELREWLSVQERMIAAVYRAKIKVYLMLGTED
jgi:hypothetical protein